MKDCLVTKLKATIANHNLPILGMAKLNINVPVGTSGLSFNVRFNDTDATSILYVGDTKTTITGNISASNIPEGESTLYVPYKSITELELGDNIKHILSFNIEDLTFATNLAQINIPYQSFSGDISKLTTSAIWKLDIYACSCPQYNIMDISHIFTTDGQILDENGGGSVPEFLTALAQRMPADSMFSAMLTSNRIVWGELAPSDTYAVQRYKFDGQGGYTWLKP